VLELSLKEAGERMITPDRKVRKLMEEYTKTGNLSKAAMRADMDVKTARKYVRSGKLPTEMRVEHTWRTREDPFREDWEEVAGILERAPELEAKALFEWLCEKHPGRYEEGQLRTLQRRVREWRALRGPEKEIFFPQEHEAGQRMATDFTKMNKLWVTINGEAYPHQLCHSVLTYSNWEWAVVCQSESYAALRKGVQAALFRLGRVPREHWTDHSTGATHRIGKEAGRGFNQSYKGLMGHYRMVPRTIEVGEANQNGDVESANGGLKRRLKQQLLLRGSRDFASMEAYVEFLHGVMERANRQRRKRLEEELSVMRVLDVRALPEWDEVYVRVNKWGTIRVERNNYSIPTRLRDQWVRVKVYEERIEVWYRGVMQLSTERLLGEGKHRINYRHVIGGLVRKPGAFRRYRYREDLFPSEVYRWAYEALCGALSELVADREYVRILHHAALTMESRVAQVLSEFRREGKVPRWERVLERTAPPRGEVPQMAVLVVNLGEYDGLLGRGEVRA
jgi:hypothetical protein